MMLSTAENRTFQGSLVVLAASPFEASVVTPTPCAPGQQHVNHLSSVAFQFAAFGDGLAVLRGRLQPRVWQQ